MRTLRGMLRDIAKAVDVEGLALIVGTALIAVATLRLDPSGALAVGFIGLVVLLLAVALARSPRLP